MPFRPMRRGDCGRAVLESTVFSHAAAAWPVLESGGAMRARGGKPGWGFAVLLGAAALLLVSSGVSSHRPNAKKMSQAAVMQAAAGSGSWFTEELLGFHLLGELVVWETLDTWVCSLLGSIMVGLSGIFPLLVIPIEAGAALKTEAGCQRLKQLLSFAIGGLLGDVFLHLLPEAWAYSCSLGLCPSRLPHPPLRSACVSLTSAKPVTKHCCSCARAFVASRYGDYARV
ncbi:hypothetical protein JZ751_021104 [Albula glossodonta]|uniref:Solute carrier family 39 member 13 n=1 Tax=Albula glossodonta TaxID=121402 RepID=A0A8T2PKF4_9TELE|nr:hypothetical protein JZ751_021104 [Albula glossodonta]